MRYLALFLPLLLAPAFAGDEGVVKSEEFNFEIRTPKYSVDWEVKEVDKEREKAGTKCHFRTMFADSDPPTYADIHVSVTPMPKEYLRMGLNKIAKKWSDAMEGHLQNKRERSENAGKLGGQDCWIVDVQGDYIAGVHQRTWMLTKMGKYMYMIYVDRNYKAVGDEDLEDEVQEILKSFKFLRIEKVEKHSEGKAGPGVGDGGPTAKEKKIDPELLKKERFKEPFWRFQLEKPEGLVKLDLSENEAKTDTKYKFQRDLEGARLMIRVYAQTEKAKKWTIDQLVDHKLDYFKKEVKVAKDPKIDKKHKFPMSKKAVKVDLVGRGKTTTIRRTWILVQCKNDRQYQIEIYLTGTNGPTVFGKTIELFLKKFKPFKK
jgi:hypothetical protein